MSCDAATTAGLALAAPRPEPQGALLLPGGEGWGLTDLLAAGPEGLLALFVALRSHACSPTP